MREPARTLLETMVNKIMGARTRSRRRQRPTPWHAGRLSIRRERCRPVPGRRATPTFPTLPYLRVAKLFAPGTNNLSKVCRAHNAVAAATRIGTLAVFGLRLDLGPLLKTASVYTHHLLLGPVELGGAENELQLDFDPAAREEPSQKRRIEATRTRRPPMPSPTGGHFQHPV